MKDIDRTPISTDHELALIELGEARTKLLTDLVSAGSVSAEFAQSDVSERFELNPAKGTDAIKHILVGDHDGGLHHLRTMMELDVPNRTAYSLISDPKKPEKTPKQFEKDQKVRQNGTAKPLGVVIDGKLKYVPKTTDKLSGSVLFPDTWCAEDVLCAVVLAVDSGEPEVDIERQSIVHTAEVEGVKVRAVTDLNTGKIITASPRYNRG